MTLVYIFFSLLILTLIFGIWPAIGLLVLAAFGLAIYGAIKD